MADKISVELDDSFLKKFFGLTDQLVPEMDEVTLPALKKQLLNIEDEIGKLKEVLEMDKNKPLAKAKRIQELFGGGDDTSTSSPNAKNQSGKSVQKRASSDGTKGRVLIVDDLGVITFQLSTMLKRMNFECITSNDIVGAIDNFKKNHYDFVLMDLFIPTQREGFILLDELKKISADKPYKTVIGIMSASNKKEYKLACSQKGSDFYIEKNESWQDEVCKLIDNYE